MNLPLTFGIRWGYHGVGGLADKGFELATGMGCCRRCNSQRRMVFEVELRGRT